MLIPQRAIAWLLVISLVAFTAMSSSCTSMKRVTLSPAEGGSTFGRIRVGDTVAVQLSNGKEHRFVVAAIEGETLVARDGTRVRRSEILAAKLRSTSVIKTTFLVSGLAAGGFFLLAYVLFVTQGIGG
jgi:hypothetical protein